MSEIITDWLKYKLGLEVPNLYDSAEFQNDLANGVLIAEILRKYGVLSDDEFISLKHNNTPKIRRSNMAHVAQWLYGSPLKINESDLQDIANKKAGVGMKLLYELYLWFEYGPRVPKVSGQTLKCFEFGNEFLYTADWCIPEAYEPRIEENKNSEKCAEELGKDIKGEIGKLYSSEDRPLSQSSESMQAQHIYFNSRTLEILQKQAKELEIYTRDRKRRLEESQEKAKVVANYCSIEFNSQERLDSESIRERKKEKALVTHKIQVQELLDDMSKFNSSMKQFHSTTKLESSRIPIYENGCGDPCGYELKMRLLKCKRQAEKRDEELRSLNRKQILDHFTEKTSSKMLKYLHRDALKELTNLPISEKLLAEYIRQCYHVKEHFINHATYDARQLQHARIMDLNKELRIQKQDKQLREYSTAEEFSPKKSFDFVCRVLEEPDVIERLSTADDTIHDMLERALKIKQEPPPPPPPCTPTFLRGKHCREVQHETFGTILVCEDESLGEEGYPRISMCTPIPPEEMTKDE